MKQGKMTLEQQRLVIDNLRLIHKVIKSMIITGYEYEELYACGYEFLCIAAVKFDKSRTSSRFSTYAYIVIRNGILEFFKKENRYRLRKDKTYLLDHCRLGIDKVLDMETVRRAFNLFLENASSVPIKRGISILYENVINGISLEDLAKRYKVTKNTAYLNMLKAKAYIRNRPANEIDWLFESKAERRKNE